MTQPLPLVYAARVGPVTQPTLVTAIMKSIKDAYKMAKKAYMMANSARKLVKKVVKAGVAGKMMALQKKKMMNAMV